MQRLKLGIVSPDIVGIGFARDCTIIEKLLKLEPNVGSQLKLWFASKKNDCINR